MINTKNQTITAYNQSAAALAKKFDNQGARIEDIYEIFSYITKQSPYILEIGCGNGRDAKEILTKTTNYLGIDVAEEMIKLAKQKNPTGRFEVADIESYQLPTKLDAIVAFASLIHIPINSFHTVIDKASQNLNQNGIFFISLKYGKEYQEQTKTDEFGTRTFYYYSEKDIKTLAEGKLTIKKIKVRELRDQLWMEVILQKQ